MAAMTAHLFVSDGRDQFHRRPQALCGDYFQLNEMSFEQLLALATEYARLVRFFQLDLSADGDWNQYFSADETVLMAAVLAVDTERMLALFEQRLQRQPRYADWFERDMVQPLDGGYRDVIDSPLLAARVLDGWMSAILRLQGVIGQEVKRLLEGILRGLEVEMEALAASVPPSLPEDAGPLFSRHFIGLTRWREIPPRPIEITEARHSFHTLTQAVRMLQNGIRQRLPKSLDSGDHDPGISLLIGFIQLFQQLLQRLNRFGDKRIDFYYQRVLDMQPQPQKPDSAFLVIRPTAAARQIQIEAGAEFIGGVDDNLEDIIYATERAATLSDARVAGVHSLYFERNASDDTVGSYHRAFEMLQLDSDERDHEKLPPMPLMGAPKPGEPLHGRVSAGFGFAVASKVLLLREGERKVRVLFQYRDPVDPQRNPVDATLKEIMEQVRRNPKRRQNVVRKLSVSDVFVRLFRAMFRISVTTADGWYHLPEYRPEYRDMDDSLPPGCLVLEFVLPASAPATECYNAALHGAGYDTTLPVARFEMTQNEYRYPYDILSNWILQDIRIDVDVRGVRKLLLHNQIGQLSALAPFMPFGPLPAVGAYMIVGCEEILYKQLRDLSIDVEWTGLPAGLGGFAEYYRAYPVPLKSGEVQASVSVLADGRWIKTGDTAPVFRYVVNADGSPTNLTSPESTISFQPTVQYYKPLRMPPVDGVPFNYTSSSMNGLFMLTLEGPDGALGHQQYPGLLSQVLTHNAQMKKPLLMKPLPNPPYTPQISRIALNYRASARIAFEKPAATASLAETESFFHLHPLGWQAMFSADTRLISQIPVYEHPGNLLIGVEGKDLRGTLSLYFYLREDSLPMTHIKDAGLRWWYLSDNRWRELAANSILEDSTKGFMTSGIVLLQLPDDIDTTNTVMPSGVFWLRATAKDGVERFCSLYAIYAQAIKVTWRADRGKKPQAVMPAMRITKSAKNIPGVDSIYQIRRSFDGKAAESASQFRVRASERLRHKNRALTAADYELLILERFPQVYKVKCFANLCSEQDEARRVRPGHILIVAIPHLNRDGHVNQRPTLSGHLIHEIQQFIRQYAMSDATISVENPVYEEIQVRCTVKLTSQLNSGRLIERINQELCDYLSPWNAKGIHQHFGWTLRQHDVVAFLLDLDCVEEVTGVSLLQIAPLGLSTDRRYSLQDNARSKDAGSKTIHPSYPWSIAVPMNQHWILSTDRLEARDGVPIGIKELKVGSTFIISSRNKP
jgi:hypothetical protein